MSEGQETVIVVADCGSQTVNNFDASKLKDRSYKGEDYNVDAGLANGPNQNRRCTDCFFLIIWFAFLIAMMAMTIDGYVNGNGPQMLAPINQDRQICGFSYGVEDYPLLYVPDLNTALENGVSDYFLNGWCAQVCPTVAGEEPYCQNDLTTGTSQCVITGVTTYATSQILNYCIPTAASVATNAPDYVSESFATSSYYLSMYESRWVIFISIFIALFLSLVYIKFMDWCAVYLAWATLVVIEIALGTMGYFSYAYAQDVLSTNGDERNGQTASLLLVASVCWIMAGVFYLVMLCNFKSLKISIAIIETAADFFADTKRIAIMPFIYFALWVMIFIFFLWGLTGVCSITDSQITVSSIQFQSKDVNRSSGTNWMIAGMTLGMVWISAFIMACNEFAIICAATSWYFSRKDLPCDDGIPGEADVFKGLLWTYRYHMGTLAFGSFILTIVWLVKSTLEYLGEKVHQATAGNCCVGCLLCCIRCVLDCFDRFVRFLNQNAYIYCAITSENFCPSALHSFLLILKNSAKFSFVESIAGSFMFLAKMFVALCTTMIAYLILPPMTAPINVDPTTPCIFVFLFAYLVACSFISIFDVSAITILQCYLYDLDISKHHNLELKHVPPTLLKFLAIHEECTKGEVVVIMDPEAKQNLLEQ